MSMEDSMKSNHKPKPNPNLEAKPTPTPKPNPKLTVVDSQLSITRRFVNNLSICRSSIGDHPNQA